MSVFEVGWGETDEGDRASDRHGVGVHGSTVRPLARARPGEAPSPVDNADTRCHAVNEEVQRGTRPHLPTLE